MHFFVPQVPKISVKLLQCSVDLVYQNILFILQSEEKRKGKIRSMFPTIPRFTHENEIKEKKTLLKFLLTAMAS